MTRLTRLCLIGLYSVAAADCAQAVTIDMVPVGNPGNAADTEVMTCCGSVEGTSGYGAVAYNYQIGKYEITAGQYTVFLNAVADADPNGLYNTDMGSLPNLGANIQRTGSSPTYSYSVAADWANRPVNYVSLWDAARFANWLHNGQPTGAQGPGTTEGGAYHDVGDLELFGRNAGAKFFVPTEDEWYKAAYHDKTAGLAASYFDYPTGTNAVPGRDMNETTNPGNNANYYTTNYLIGSPYYRTVVGEFELSDSPYGTFDQGGNVWEWNETAVNLNRGLRGGSFYVDGGSNSLLASFDVNDFPHIENIHVGFRVASIPELPGDFNHDGAVNAADYVVWRKGVGVAPTPANYNLWRANFGQPGGSGSSAGATGSGSDAVPEPATLALTSVGVLGLIMSRRRRAT